MESPPLMLQKNNFINCCFKEKTNVRTAFITIVKKKSNLMLQSALKINGMYINNNNADVKTNT